jgi:hypothetical protein
MGRWTECSYHGVAELYNVDTAPAPGNKNDAAPALKTKGSAASCGFVPDFAQLVITMRTLAQLSWLYTLCEC